MADIMEMTDDEFEEWRQEQWAARDRLLHRADDMADEIYKAEDLRNSASRLNSENE